MSNDSITIKEWNTYQKYALGGYAKAVCCRYDGTPLAMNLQDEHYCLSCGAKYSLGLKTITAVKEFIDLLR